jgi:hypothetical protein
MKVKDTDIKENFTTMITKKALNEAKLVNKEWKMFKKTENEYGQSD